MGLKSLFNCSKKKCLPLPIVSTNNMSSSANATPTPSRVNFINSRARIEEELEQVFKKFNVNGDENISSSELGSIMGSLDHPPTEEELENMIKEVDSDGDGFIGIEPRISGEKYMVSSKVMVTTISPASPDLPRHSTSSSIHFSELQIDHGKNFGSMNMDNLLKNIYADYFDVFSAVDDGTTAAGLASQGSFSLPKSVGSKTVDEVWKEIVSGCSGGENRGVSKMTLEDFLTKAGAVEEEDIVRLSVALPPTKYVVDSIIGALQFNMQPAGNAPGSFGVEAVGYGSGIMVVGTPTDGGRGKRRAVEELPVDKTTQQKQRGL